MHLLWLKALHLVGAVLWMGASIAVALVAAAASGNERAPVAALARRGPGTNDIRLENSSP